MAEARLFIKTKTQKLINEYVKVLVDGMLSSLFVREVSYVHRTQKPELVYDDEEDSEVSSPAEGFEKGINRISVGETPKDFPPYDPRMMVTKENKGGFREGELAKGVLGDSNCEAEENTLEKDGVSVGEATRCSSKNVNIPYHALNACNDGGSHVEGSNGEVVSIEKVSFEKEFDTYVVGTTTSLFRSEAGPIANEEVFQGPICFDSECKKLKKKTNWPVLLTTKKEEEKMC